MGDGQVGPVDMRNRDPSPLDAPELLLASSGFGINLERLTSFAIFVY